MATPTKNYTDPNGVPFKLAPPMPSQVYGTPTTGLCRRVSVLLPFVPIFHLRATRVMVPPESERVFSQIPPPPMGKKILTTFPSVYKERQTINSGTLGQIYPPPAP